MEMNIISNLEINNLLSSINDAKKIDIDKFHFVSFVGPDGMYAVLRRTDVEVNTPLTDSDIVLRFVSPLSFFVFASAINTVFEKYSSIIRDEPDQSVN